MLGPDQDTISWLRLFIAATTVIGLMGALALALKYVSTRGWIRSLPGNQRRLKIIENMSLDARRRLVIVQCDDTEHLLLLGLNQDIVVASDLPSPPNLSSVTCIASSS